MLIAYVDESYDRDRYFIGAAIGTQEAWFRLESDFATIRGRTAELHGTPLDVEFHGHEVMGGSGAWAPLRGMHREAAGVFRSVLRTSRHAGIRYLFRGVDVRRLNARYSYPDSPHSIVFGHVLEQIDDFTAASRQPERTIVVADQIATQADHQREFAGYQLFGTGGYRSTRLLRIASPLNFADSSKSDGLQAVDLATYVYYRRQCPVPRHPKAQVTQDRLWREIAPAVDHQFTWVP